MIFRLIADLKRRKFVSPVVRAFFIATIYFWNYFFSIYSPFWCMSKRRFPSKISFPNDFSLMFFSAVDRANRQHRLRVHFERQQSPTNPHNTIADGVGVSSARSHHHESSTSAKSSECRWNRCGAANRHRSIAGAAKRQCQREVPQVLDELNRPVEARAGAGGA